MPLSTFQTTTSDHDLDAIQDKSSSTPLPSRVSLEQGTFTGKGDGVNMGHWVVFQLTGIPRNATINGAMIEYTSVDTRAAGTGYNFYWGFLRDDGIWSNGDGFATSNYPTRADLPMGFWKLGTNEDIDAWVDRTGPANTITNISAVTTDTAYSVGDGTGVSPTDTCTGFTDQLALAVADADTDDPWVAVHAGQDYPGNVDELRDWHSNDGATSSYAPELHVDWTEPPPTSSFEIVPQAQDGSSDCVVSINGTFREYDGTDIGGTATWTSSIEGLVHTGSNLAEDSLSVGVHTMTVVCTDSNAMTDTTIFTLTVYDVPDDLANAVAAATVEGGSLQVAGGYLAVAAGGTGTEKAVVVIDRIL